MSETWPTTLDVERALDAYYPRFPWREMQEWPTPEGRTDVRRLMRAALLAAAPHLSKGEWPMDGDVVRARQAHDAVMADRRVWGPDSAPPYDVRMTAIRAALQAASPPPASKGEWRGIEECEFAATVLLGVFPCPRGLIFNQWVGSPGSKVNGRIWNGRNMNWEPTHFMPLPPPPSPE